MRKDMDKVLTERPRGGRDRFNRHIAAQRRPSHWFQRQVEEIHDGEEPGDAPSLEVRDDVEHQTRRNEGIDRGRTRFFSDLLGPMRRMLLRYIGRSWDTVYSEASKIFDSRKRTGQHVRDHLLGYVERDISVNDDGELVYFTGREYRLVSDGVYRGVQFYVDPRDGTLRRFPKMKPRVTPPLVDVKVINSKLVLAARNGVWFSLSLEEPQENTLSVARMIRQFPNLQIVDYGYSFYAGRRTYFPDELREFCTNAEKYELIVSTLSKKEKKRYGLKE